MLGSAYEDLFTSSGVGKLNMVDFFRDMSHGQLDLSGSKVFGWYTLDKNRSDYLAGGDIEKGRGDLIKSARQAASKELTKKGPFFSVVVCMNVPTDLFGGADGVVCDDGRWPDDNNGPGMSSLSPSLLGQEMGHGYGLAHSRADGSGSDYMDPWDVMSTTATPFMSPHPNFTDLDVRARPVFRLGPGLNRGQYGGSRLARRVPRVEARATDRSTRLSHCDRFIAEICPASSLRDSESISSNSESERAGTRDSTGQPC